VKELPPPKEFNERALEELNDIGDVSRERGAHAYFLLPSYIDRSYSINTGAIAWLVQRLAKEMRIPILGTPEDFVYPPNWFFDTRYHLNEVGRASRTLTMIEILRKARVRDGW